jgi:hypothetical protein
MQHLARRLNTALAGGNAGEAAALFADDAVFEDIPAHLQLIGPAAIRGYLERVGTTLPYATSSVAVRHTVGSAQGGGYEWKSAGPVPRGITALELNRSGRITRLTALWDGSLADDQTLAELQHAAVEH